VTDGDSTPASAPSKKGLAPAWQKGQSGNPIGRPKGSKNKLSEQFVAALQADFEQHGADTIAVVRQTDPGTYLRVISRLVPAEVSLDLKTNVSDWDDSEIIAALETLRANLNKGESNG
tara:strand:- start:1801 stop:2154 length:354 start_codon:yes stop_codon:yes gene_type:complete